MELISVSHQSFFHSRRSRSRLMTWSKFAASSPIGFTSRADARSAPNLAESNQALAEERRMCFRIGINVGDVMVKDGDIFGDGVNRGASRRAGRPRRHLHIARRPRPYQAHAPLRLRGSRRAERQEHRTAHSCLSSDPNVKTPESASVETCAPPSAARTLSPAAPHIRPSCCTSVGDGPKGRERLQRAFLVNAHQTAKALDIGCRIATTFRSSGGASISPVILEWPTGSMDPSSVEPRPANGAVADENRQGCCQTPPIRLSEFV